jgi:5-hydroxyisourate hydrolase-like protein (transthyretin family)
MNLILMLCTLLWPQASPAQQSAKPTASISGHVARVDTGKPITNASVRLARSAPGGSSQPVAVAVDAQGAFTFTGLSAGPCVLMVSAVGFVNLDASPTQPTGRGKPIDLKDAEQLDRVDIAMAPTSSIDGRVLDEFGDPAPGVNVQIAQLMYAAGRSRFMPVGTNRSPVTDDLGHFRVSGLAPGDYYLIALSGPFSAPSMSVPTDDRAGFASTYFPGTAIATEAKPVRLEVGKDASDIVFPLVATEHIVTVSGRVVDAAGKPAARVQLILMQTLGGDVRAMIPAALAPNADGSFMYRNVPAGTYVLQAMAQGGFGTVLVNAARDPVSDLVVTIHPPTTARGHISFEGGTPPAVGQVGVAVRPTDFVSGPAGGNAAPRPTYNEDWTFEIPGLQSVGRLDAMSAPPWGLKSIMVAGQDITDTPYDFRINDVSGIEVTFTTRLPSLAGAVQDDGKPVSDCTIIVFAADGGKWDFPSRFIRQTRPNQQGAFTITGFPPGRYLVVAVPGAQPPDPDPTFLESLRAVATSLTIDEGDARTLDVKLIKR